MSELYMLSYCSRNRIDGDAATMERELAQILEVARRKNLANGVTGALLHNAGSFAQVLEGPRDVIEETFERIQCDDRHGEVMLLHAGPIRQRSFPEWSMAFVGGAETVAAPEVMAALRAAQVGAPGAGERVLEILRGLVVEEGAWAMG